MYWFSMLIILFRAFQTSAVAEAQKLMTQAADLLSAIHNSLHHGMQAQNDTTKGGMYQMTPYFPFLDMLPS